jgi:hypothetical protein
MNISDVCPQTQNKGPNSGLSAEFNVAQFTEIDIQVYLLLTLQHLSHQSALFIFLSRLLKT